MPFDYKKADKEFYLPSKTPGVITVPAMNFLAVRGQGDPNVVDGAYQQALRMLELPLVRQMPLFPLHRLYKNFHSH